MATINLAPGTQYLVAIRRRRLLLAAASTGIIVIILGAWLLLFVLTHSTTQRTQQAEEKIRAYDTKIAELGKDAARIGLFEGRLQALEGLFNVHVSWVPVFKEIERLLPASIVLRAVATDAKDGVVEVEGKAPDLDQIAQTLASLVATEGHVTLFKRAELGSTKQGNVIGADGLVAGTEYQFSAKLFFDPSTLHIYAASNR